MRQFQILIAHGRTSTIFILRIDWMDGWMTGWEKFVCNKLIIVKFNFRLKCFSLSPFSDLFVVDVVVYAGMPFGYICNLYWFRGVSLLFFSCSLISFYLIRWNRQRKQHMSLDWCPAKRLIFCAIKLAGRDPSKSFKCSNQASNSN